ncbi:MAG: YcxB family protein [Candidatus Accumulibacter sp.]|jgi:hypothetical protein|nr:YcxB family protein [Accumulibacter sp.]
MTPIHIRYRLDKRQMGAAFQLVARRQQQNAGWRRVLPWMQVLGGIILALMPALLAVKGALVHLWWISGLLLFLGNVLYRDWWYERYANSIGEQHLTIDGYGILIRSAIAESRYTWSQVREVSVQTGWLAIVFSDIQAVQAVPDSAFADAEARQAFLAAMQAGMQARDVPAASAQTQQDPAPPDDAVAVAENPPAAPSSGFFADLLQLGRILTFRAPRAGTLAPEAWKFILLVLLFGSLCLCLQLWEYGLSGSFSWYGAQECLLPFAFVALIAGLTRWIGGKEIDGARLWLALTLLLLCLPLVGAWENWVEDWPSSSKYRDIPAIWIALTGAAQVGHLSFASCWRLRNVMAWMVAWLGLLWLFVGYALPIIWYPQQEEDHSYLRVDENILYGQSALMAAMSKVVQPGTPGVPELFFLGVGGETQDVFLREVRAVETLFTERFGTRGHSLMLVNNKATAATLPMANLVSLRQALTLMGQRMNEEDTLFLFLTSHGSPNRLSFALWPFRFNALSPDELRQALNIANIKRRVVVVSACYSGSFIPALADENTLVITASAADRNSFGCSDKNELTQFGRAYFNDALRQTRSFTRAFELASERITAREKADGLTPSLPQMQGGEALSLSKDEIETETP